MDVEAMGMAINCHFATLKEALRYSFPLLLNFLLERAVISSDIYDIIASKPNLGCKLHQLFSELKYTNDGYGAFLKFLQCQNQHCIVDVLMGERHPTTVTDDTIAVAISVNYVTIKAALWYHVALLLSFLVENKIISLDECDIIDLEATEGRKLQRLLHVIRYKDNGYKELFRFMEEHNQRNVVDEVLGKSDKKCIEQFVAPCVVLTNRVDQYNILVRDMLAKATREGTLSEKISGSSWRTSHVIQVTSAVAHWGCLHEKYEFTESELSQFGDIRDSVKCQFLYFLFPRLPSHERRAQFNDQTLQEYFAALHCLALTYEPFSTRSKDAILRTCLADGSVVGQFFFCLCSNERKFADMLDWMKLSFCDIRSLSVPSIDYLLYCVSFGLKNCTAEENKEFGRRLSYTAGRIADIITRPNDFSYSFEVAESELNLDSNLCEGLRLTFITKDNSTEGSDWFIAAEESSRADLARFVSSPVKDIRSRLAQIDVLVWVLKDHKPLTQHLDALPPVRRILARIGKPVDTEINFRVDWIEKGPIIELFSLGFKKLDEESLKSALLSVCRDRSYKLSRRPSVLQTTVLQGGVTVSWASMVSPKSATSPSQVVFGAVLSAINGGTKKKAICTPRVSANPTDFVRSGVGHEQQ